MSAAPGDADVLAPDGSACSLRGSDDRAVGRRDDGTLTYGAGVTARHHFEAIAALNDALPLARAISVAPLAAAEVPGMAPCVALQQRIARVHR